METGCASGERTVQLDERLSAESRLRRSVDDDGVAHGRKRRPHADGTGSLDVERDGVCSRRRVREVHRLTEGAAVTAGGAGTSTKLHSSRSAAEFTVVTPDARPIITPREKDDVSPNMAVRPVAVIMQPTAGAGNVSSNVISYISLAPRNISPSP